MNDDAPARGLEPDEGDELDEGPSVEDRGDDRQDGGVTGSGDESTEDQTDPSAGSDPDKPSTDEESASTNPNRTETQQVDATAAPPTEPEDTQSQPGVPEVPKDVRQYDRFKKIEGGKYDRVNDFLRNRTYITAREWAIARLCADFRTETGVEMTKIGQNLPQLVPFMTDTYSPQAVNQARHAFEEKVRKSGATFLYGAISGFFTAEELDDVMYETTEVAKFLLEVEGVDLSVDEELDAEDRISEAMREVRTASEEIRHRGTECPECGHEIGGDPDE